MILDASVFIAVFHESDIHHNEAIGVFRQAEKRKIVVSDYLLNEIITVMLRKTDLKRTNQILDFLLNDETLVIRHTSREEFFEIIDVFKAQKDRLSFVDCSILWLAEKSDFKVFTFDKNLQKELDARKKGKSILEKPKE